MILKVDNFSAVSYLGHIKIHAAGKPRNATPMAPKTPRTCLKNHPYPRKKKVPPSFLISLVRSSVLP